MPHPLPVNPLRSHLDPIGQAFRIAGITSFVLGDKLGDELFGLTCEPSFWIVLLAPLAMVFFLSFRIDVLSLGTAQLCFWAYAALVGLSLSGIFLVYTGEIIARVFFISAATFSATSIYGYTTRTDLTRFGSFLFMGLIGVIIASLVNLFLTSTALQFAISIVGVLLFTGLTAYDTQRIKDLYTAGDDGVAAGKKAVMGALTLYLDFLNLFLMMMQLFGNRRN